MNFTHAILYEYDGKTHIFLVHDVRETIDHITAEGYRLVEGDRFRNNVTRLTFATDTVEVVKL